MMDVEALGFGTYNIFEGADSPFFSMMRYECFVV
jgi:hypothetical protein